MARYDPRVARPTVQLRGARARDAIVRAAGERFLADGLRATSVEAIASTAGVSRPTVYAHFASKDEVFRAVVTRLHDKQIAAMEAAVDADAPIAGRLYDTLAARFVPVVTLTASSPHGAELLDESSRACGDIVREARKRSLRLLEGVLATADRAGDLDLAAAELTAATAAALFYDAARVAKEESAVTPAAYRRQLRRLVRVFVRGLAADGPPRSERAGGEG
jgi:TetR/AcrR family transcriptional repressor of mexJK operon